jgi:hypothetical protein
MCYGKMADFSRDLEKYDFLGGHKLAQDIFKNDSDNVEGIGRALGWRELENQARWNQANPEEGMAHAATATAAGFLAPYLSGLAGAGTGATGYVDSIGNAAEGASAGLSTTGGLMAGASGGANAQQALKMMQMMQGMQGQQPQQPVPQPPRQGGQLPELDTGYKGYEPMPKEFRYMTEEEKRKLLMQRRGY